MMFYLESMWMPKLFKFFLTFDNVFVGWIGRRKYLPSFSSAVQADENSSIFVGCR
jgi:hypothetical protein